MNKLNSLKKRAEKLNATHDEYAIMNFNGALLEDSSGNFVSAGMNKYALTFKTKSEAEKMKDKIDKNDKYSIVIAVVDDNGTVVRTRK